jgi:hypothetical protein
MGVKASICHELGEVNRDTARTINHLGSDETICRTVASSGRHTKDVDADLVRRGCC